LLRRILVGLSGRGHGKPAAHRDRIPRGATAAGANLAVQYDVIRIRRKFQRCAISASGCGRNPLHSGGHLAASPASSMAMV